MRLALLIAVLLCGGCKSAEIAVEHQMTGLHVAAKFVAKDAGGASQWNGGDAEELLRR